MSALGGDGVVEVGVDVPQMPIALIGEICSPRQEGAPTQVRSFLPGDATPTLNSRQAHRVSSSKAS